MNLPKDFLALVEPIIPVSEQEDFILALNAELPVSIRLNPFKKHDKKDLTPIPWTETGYYLPTREKFTFDPLFHAGCYYVQEAGSMLLEQALKQTVDTNEKIIVLDLCASPGGKSTHLLSLINDQSILVSNEVIGSRLPALEQNIIKWGQANTILTNNDPKAFSKLKGQFDVIVVDAPCSGEGMFRKHTHAIDEWSLDHVNLCSLRQQRILEDVWPALKENGILIYSTCTFNLVENETNLLTFIANQDAESLSLNLPNSWGIKSVQKEHVYGYHAIPHQTKSEGFFISVLRKKSAENGRIKSQFKLKPVKENSFKHILNEPVPMVSEFEFFEVNQNIHAFLKHEVDFLNLILNHLKVIQFGLNVGEKIRTDFIPSAALALSNNLNKNAFTNIEVDLENALRYLQKDSIQVNSNQKEFQLINFQNFPLGFIKNLGNRSNNLYPKNWRILNKQV